MLYVVVMICAASEPQCDAAHARSYESFVAPPGIVICSAPAVFAARANSPLAANERETFKIRCEWRAK